ncbi:MAG: porin [Rhizobiales bacterium]|nr:porin [Hyphomicrobiales bacterium]
MKLRSLLLGAAAVVSVSATANAADLAVAVEPIDYVKICDAFGVGYWYIPGTDTCLKVGGYVRLDVWFYNEDKVGNYFNVANYLTGATTGTTDPSNPLAQTSGSAAGYIYAQDNYSQSWEMKTKAAVNWESRSMSDLGVIATSIDLAVESNNNNLDGTAKSVYLDGAYGAIGPMMFGWTESTFDPGDGYTYDGAVRSDQKVDQFRLSYMMGTWGIMLGLEDPRDRSTGLPTNATGNYPDIVLAVTGGVGGLDLRGAVAITDRTTGTGWAANLAATAKLGVVDIKGTVAYSDGAKSYTGGSNCSNVYSGGAWQGCDDGQWWSGFLSAAVALSSNLKAAGTVSYQDATGGQSYDAGSEWTAAAGLYYYPTARSEIGAELLYSDPEDGDSEWGGHLRFKTNFN